MTRLSGTEIHLIAKDVEPKESPQMQPPHAPEFRSGHARIGGHRDC
ncbi:hypothetical protein RRSWK_06723 [Rhodopirellula sp. SWK7]|nr:hypothetical protein RRSWK_06723 [Rhodopirellula sp. SWK7]